MVFLELLLAGSISSLLPPAGLKLALKRPSGYFSKLWRVLPDNHVILFSLKCLKDLTLDSDDVSVTTTVSCHSNQLLSFVFTVFALPVI